MHTNEYEDYTFVRSEKINDNVSITMYKPNIENDFYKGHLVEVSHPKHSEPIVFFERTLESVLKEIKKK